jgi:hypothetical protein
MQDWPSFKPFPYERCKGDFTMIDSVNHWRAARVETKALSLLSILLKYPTVIIVASLPVSTPTQPKKSAPTIKTFPGGNCCGLA